MPFAAAAVAASMAWLCFDPRRSFRTLWFPLELAAFTALQAMAVMSVVLNVCLREVLERSGALGKRRKKKLASSSSSSRRRRGGTGRTKSVRGEGGAGASPGVLLHREKLTYIFDDRPAELFGFFGGGRNYSSRKVMTAGTVDAEAFGVIERQGRKERKEREKNDGLLFVVEKIILCSADGPGVSICFLFFFSMLFFGRSLSAVVGQGEA